MHTLAGNVFCLQYKHLQYMYVHPSHNVFCGIRLWNHWRTMRHSGSEPFFKADKDKISTRRDRQSSVFFFFSWLTDRHHTKRQQQSPPLISVNLSLSLALSRCLSPLDTLH